MNKIVFLSLGVMVWLVIGCAPVESTPVAVPTSTHADKPAVARQIQPTPILEIEPFEDEDKGLIFQWILTQRQKGHSIQAIADFLDARSTRYAPKLSVAREIVTDSFDEPVWHVCVSYMSSGRPDTIGLLENSMLLSDEHILFRFKGCELSDEETIVKMLAVPHQQISFDDIADDEYETFHDQIEPGGVKNYVFDAGTPDGYQSLGNIKFASSTPLSFTMFIYSQGQGMSYSGYNNGKSYHHRNKTTFSLYSDDKYHFSVVNDGAETVDYTLNLNMISLDQKNTTRDSLIDFMITAQKRGFTRVAIRFYVIWFRSSPVGTDDGLYVRKHGDFDNNDDWLDRPEWFFSIRSPTDARRDMDWDFVIIEDGALIYSSMEDINVENKQLQPIMYDVLDHNEDGLTDYIILQEPRVRGSTPILYRLTRQEDNTFISEQIPYPE